MNKFLDSPYIVIIIFIILILINLDGYFNSGAITGIKREGFILPGITLITIPFVIRALSSIFKSLFDK